MPIQTIVFKGNIYPQFQSSGYASRFVLPFAMEICTGRGVDVGYSKDTWMFPSDKQREVTGIDIINSNGYHATSFPEHAKDLDFVFSSHCLEHLLSWVEVLDYWHSRLRSGGVLFLYLPDASQKYWRPYYNRKHIHMFSPQILKYYFTDQDHMWKNTFISGVDLNNSFAIMAEKI